VAPVGGSPRPTFRTVQTRGNASVSSGLTGGRQAKARFLRRGFCDRHLGGQEPASLDDLVRPRNRRLFAWVQPAARLPPVRTSITTKSSPLSRRTRTHRGRVRKMEDARPVFAPHLLWGWLGNPWMAYVVLSQPPSTRLTYAARRILDEYWTPTRSRGGRVRRGLAHAGRAAGVRACRRGRSVTPDVARQRGARCEPRRSLRSGGRRRSRTRRRRAAGRVTPQAAAEKPVVAGRRRIGLHRAAPLGWVSSVPASGCPASRPAFRWSHKPRPPG